MMERLAAKIFSSTSLPSDCDENYYNQKKKTNSNSLQLQQQQRTQLRNLRCLATLKELPASYRRYSRIENVEMTWTQPHGCAVYLYDF